MPGKNGLQILRAIRAAGSQTPIFMVTAESNREPIVEAIHSGVSDYLIKPFDQRALMTKLKSLCHGSGAADTVSADRARDAMSTGVVTIKADVTLQAALKTLLKHRISGLPVVDDEGRLIGIVSEADLTKLVYDSDVMDEKIQDHMTKGVLTVDEEWELSEVAKMMDEHRIRRIPVIRNDQVVGIVARRDLLRYVEETVTAG